LSAVTADLPTKNNAGELMRAIITAIAVILVSLMTVGLSFAQTRSQTSSYNRCAALASQQGLNAKSASGRNFISAACNKARPWSSQTTANAFLSAWIADQRNCHPATTADALGSSGDMSHCARGIVMNCRTAPRHHGQSCAAKVLAAKRRYRALRVRPIARAHCKAFIVSDQQVATQSGAQTRGSIHPTGRRMPERLRAH
jgi:hypothetical protein